jgi:hypothetical protein
MTRRFVLAVLTTLTLVACTSSKGAPTVQSQTVSAQQRLTEMQALMQDTMRAVAPGAKPYDASINGPGPCTSPHKGMVTYGASFSFDMPAGKSGADGVNGMATYLRQRGYKVQVSDDGNTAGLLASNGKSGLDINGDKAGPRAKLIATTACGQPSEHDKQLLGL